MLFSTLYVGFGLVATTLAAAQGRQGKSSTTWDCCKPACSWKANRGTTRGYPKVCDASNNLIRDSVTVQSGCSNNGRAYLCDSYSPFPVSEDLAYGFVATNSTDSCCQCYKVLFLSGYAAGKSMIVQAINSGDDLGDNDLAILTPGGGIGGSSPTGCTRQYGSTWGSVKGGVGQGKECEGLPANLQAGCYWRYNWAGGDVLDWDIYYDPIECPERLTSISQCFDK